MAEESKPVSYPMQGGSYTIVDGKIEPTDEELEARKAQAAALEKDPHQNGSRE